MPARPKQLMTFFFGERCVQNRTEANRGDVAPRVAVVGPQTRFRPPLSVFGRLDTFTIHFQPSGFNRLFGIPTTELTDGVYDARDVIGPEIASFEAELGDAIGFAERIRVAEARLARLAGAFRGDAVALAANRLFASHGVHRVSRMADDCGLSVRQFERRFLAQVGVSPKLYARIIRFNAALDRKLQSPGVGWSAVASDHGYYDQMHLVHDWRVFTGESPSRFVTQLDAVPEFHTLYATADRPRRD